MKVENLVANYVGSHNLAQLSKKEKVRLATHTYLSKSDDKYIIRYHSTNVVVYNPDNTITLNCGSYSTSTTKARIKKYSPAVIIQQKGIWYVCDPKNTKARFPFYDGIIVDIDGLPIQYV